MDSSQTPNTPEVPQVEEIRRINKRPWSVTLLAFGVLIITVINLIRSGLSIRYWNFINSQSGISPLYLLLTGLIWSVAGLCLLWGLWKAKKWAPRLMEAVGLTYALYYWVDHIFLMDHPVNGATTTIQLILPINWQFAAGVTVVCMVFMAWVLNRAKVKEYFGMDETEAGQNLPGKAGQG
jgi:hypothetical protein